MFLTYCKCKDWTDNIRILDGMIATQSVMAWGNKDGYTGKPFKYCPWCGRKRKIEKESK